MNISFLTTDDWFNCNMKRWSMKPIVGQLQNHAQSAENEYLVEVIIKSF